MKLKDLPPISPKESTINITPLIDIVFILLVFFMVTTTFNKDFWIELERPAAQSAKATEAEAVRVSVALDGEVVLDGAPIHSWMLQEKLREKLSYRANKDVLVVTDRRLESGTLIYIIDQCRLAGAKDVGVSTELEA